MQPRRAQQPISFRSDRAAAKLAVLTRGGRSQAEVIEEALDRIPDPVLPEPVAHDTVAMRMARLNAILDRIDSASIPTMAEFDALTYDEYGLPR